MHAVNPAIRAAPLVLLAKGPSLGGFVPRCQPRVLPLLVNFISIERLYSREPPICAYLVVKKLED